MKKSYKPGSLYWNKKNKAFVLLTHASRSDILYNISSFFPNLKLGTKDRKITDPTTSSPVDLEHVEATLADCKYIGHIYELDLESFMHEKFPQA